MGEMTKNQKKEALRAWRQKEKKSYCLEQEEVEELFEYLEEALQAEECDHSLKNTEQWIPRGSGFSLRKGYFVRPASHPAF